MYPGTPLWSPARLGGVWCTFWVSDKLFCMGISKTRLTAIQTNFGSAHFFRTWSESAPPPPSWAEGPTKGPFPPPPPLPGPAWAGAWRGFSSGFRVPPPAPGHPPAPRPPGRAYAFLAGATGEGALGRAEWGRGGARGAPGSRATTGWGGSGSGHGTRKPAQAARPRAPQASAGRPTAPPCPLQRVGGAQNAKRVSFSLEPPLT